MFAFQEDDMSGRIVDGLARLLSRSSFDLFAGVPRSRFPSSQRGDRGFGLPDEKLYLIKRLGPSHDGVRQEHENYDATWKMTGD